MVMELLDGQDLCTILEQRGKYTVPDACDAIIESVKHDVPVIALRDETWIWAGGLLNELDRRGLAFRVPAQWTFMFGKSRSRRGDERIHLLLADAHAHADLLGRPDLSLIASSDEKLVFRQLAAPLTGTTGDPRR